MKKYTFIFTDGSKETAIGGTQDAAWRSLGFDLSMIGFLSKIKVKEIKENKNELDSNQINISEGN